MDWSTVTIAACLLAACVIYGKVVIVHRMGSMWGLFALAFLSVHVFFVLAQMYFPHKPFLTLSSVCFMLAAVDVEWQRVKLYTKARQCRDELSSHTGACGEATESRVSSANECDDRRQKRLAGLRNV